MLVLSRKRDESIRIGDLVTVTVIEIRGDKVRLGIQNPPDVPVHRQEVWEAIHQETSPYSSQSTADYMSSSVRAAPPPPAALPPAPAPIDASQLRIDRDRPLDSLKAHLRTILGESQSRQIQPLLDQLTEVKGITVR